MDQLTLSESELTCEHTLILSAHNHNAPDNITRWSYRESAFKVMPQVEQTTVHFELEGTTVHQKQSNEFDLHCKSLSLALNAPLLFFFSLSFDVRCAC